MSTGKEPSSSTTSSRFPQTLHHHRLFRTEPFRVLLPPNSDSSASASLNLNPLELIVSENKLKRPLMKDEKEGLDEEQQLRVSWNGKRDHQLNINTAADHTTQERPVATVEGPSRSGGGGERSSSLMSIRRPRGRPPGSKNKTKPPIIVTRDSANTLHSQLMEIAAGSDIADAVATYSRKRQRCVCIVSGTGAVSNVTLRHNSGSEGPAVMTLPGRYELLSVTGIFLPTQTPPLMAASGLSVFLAAGQGHVVGGIVVGSLMAAGPVILVAASSANAAFERLPLITNQEDEEEDQRKEQTLIRVQSGGSAPPPAGTPCYGIPATSSVPFLPSALYNLPGNGARQRSPF